MKCMCGCGDGDHDYPGGACNNCSHCQYVEYDYALTSRDYEVLNALEPGAGDYWRDNARRVW